MIRQFLKRSQFSSIRTRLLFWFLIIALLPLILASTMIYNEMVESRKALICNTLEAVRDLKVSELDRWIDERAVDVLTISANESIRTLGMPGMDTRIPEVRAILKRYVRNYDAFDEIYIVDLRDNKVLVSSNGSVEGVISYRYGYSVDRSNSSKLFIGDIQQNVIDDHPFMLFSNPVYGPGMNRDAFGIVVIRINLDLTLYRLLLNRTGLGRTGETLIVSPEHVALNELLWHRDAPLKLRSALNRLQRH